MSCPADYRGERQVKPGNILQRADVLPEVPHLSREGSLYEEVFHFSQNVVAVPGVPLLRSSGRRWKALIPKRNSTRPSPHSMPPCLMPITAAIWKSLGHSSPTMWSFITIRVE